MNRHALPNLTLAAALARARGTLPRHVVATRAGISPSTLERAERYGVVSTRTLARLARVYGVDIDTLTGRKGKG